METKNTILISLMNEHFIPDTEPFSAGYKIVHNATVFTHNGVEAIMDAKMFKYLSKIYGSHFTGRVEDHHYTFKRVGSIPAGCVAVPEDQHDDPDTLLIQR